MVNRLRITWDNFEDTGLAGQLSLSRLLLGMLLFIHELLVQLFLN